VTGKGIGEGTKGVILKKSRQQEGKGPAGWTGAGAMGSGCSKGGLQTTQKGPWVKDRSEQKTTGVIPWLAGRGRAASERELDVMNRFLRGRGEKVSNLGQKLTRDEGAGPDTSQFPTLGGGGGRSRPTGMYA